MNEFQPWNISLSLGTVPKTGLMLWTSCPQISLMRILRENEARCASTYECVFYLLVGSCILFVSSYGKRLYHRDKYDVFSLISNLGIPKILIFLFLAFAFYLTS